MICSKTYHRTMIIALLITGALLLMMIGLASADGDAPNGADPAQIQQAIDDGLAYLQGKQLPDGGIEGWTPGTSDEYATIKTVFAFAGSGQSVGAIASVSGTTPLDYLGARAISYTHDLSGTLFPGRAGMLATAAIAGDADPIAFGGMDLVAELTGSYNPATGAYSSTAKMGFASGAADAVNQAWSMLGLAAAQERVPNQAAAFLNTLQEADGGWGYGFGGDIDLTSIAIQALVAGGISPTDESVVAGLGFLRDTQQASGGWASWGTLSPDSTGGAIQALAAAGFAPLGSGWRASDGNPMTELLAMQSIDGSFINPVGTAHAVAGMAQAPLPILGLAGRVERALSWMNEIQADDGSWSGFSGSDPGATSDAILAYTAAGYDPATIAADEGMSTALESLAAAAPDFTSHSADRAGKLALAAVTAGADPHNFGGLDLIDAITQHYSPTVGAFGATGTFTNTWYQSYAILGLVASGAEVPTGAVESLIGLQQPEGGWKYDLAAGWWSVVDAQNTGIALQALIAAGVAPTNTTIVSATAYLWASQEPTGGWDGNANSTAVAIQGLIAAGEELEADWTTEGNSPFDALASYQKPDGPFVWKWDDPWVPPEDNGMATFQAIPAMLGLSTPFAAPGTAEFARVERGPDPDRLVADRLSSTRTGTLYNLALPYGSDLNGNGSVNWSWRAAGDAEWVAIPDAGSAGGIFTASLVLSAPLPYEFSAAILDTDGVQVFDVATDTVTLIAAAAPEQLYLPAVLR